VKRGKITRFLDVGVVYRSVGGDAGAESEQQSRNAS